jgi:Ca-activated chloride channel family protein
MEVVDEIGETVNLEVLILVDASASMDDKLPTVQESLIDLSISLNSRSGNNQFAIYTFPGKKRSIERLMDWTPQLDTLGKLFKKISTGGITPTGPALQEALELFPERRSKRKLLGDDDAYIEESGS